jgi:hypothetical protein
MALFRNLGVNLLDSLCDVPRYASAQSLDFLDLAKNCSFLNWKLTPVPTSFLTVRGWARAGAQAHGALKKVVSFVLLIFRVFVMVVHLIIERVHCA